MPRNQRKDVRRLIFVLELGFLARPFHVPDARQPQRRDDEARRQQNGAQITIQYRDIHRGFFERRQGKEFIEHVEFGAGQGLGAGVHG